MARIVFIGAGSLQFTRALVRDILTFDSLKSATIVLMDINKQRLELAKKIVQKLIERTGTKANVTATMNRREALKGADAVLCTILNGGTNIWRHDIEIPKKYGIDINVGDTRGVAGIFRALRTIPVMLDICKDVEQICPNAIMLNYTNPMAMLCMVMQRMSRIKVTGLCHSVQLTVEMLARWIGAQAKDMTYLCAGINHQAWYLDLKWKGKDAYPLLRKTLQNKKIWNEDIIRNDMFSHLGYYVTESSGHNSEYNWWYRKKPQLIKQYCNDGTGWNPGKYAYILKRYLNAEKTWKKQIQNFLKDDKYPLERGNEYAAYIINAFVTGETYQFNGNVLNKGLITNLPEDVCVEVPVFVNSNGFFPISVGELPPQLAILNSLNASSEKMAVEAALTGDAEMVFHSVAYDPLTAAVLDLKSIRKMVCEMLEFNKKYLTNFKKINL